MRGGDAQCPASVVEYEILGRNGGRVRGTQNQLGNTGTIVNMLMLSYHVTSLDVLYLACSAVLVPQQLALSKNRYKNIQSISFHGCNN